MRIVVTYAPHLAQWFSDVAMAVGLSFSELGYETNLIPVKSLSSFNHSPHDLIFVIAPHGYEENGQDFVKNPKKIYACYDLEQTPYLDQIDDKTRLRFQRTLSYFHKYDFFFTEAEAKTAYFRHQGLAAHTLNFGYHSFYTKQIPNTEKEFDLFFVGIMFPRRADILNQLIREGLRLYPATSNFFDPVLKAKAIRSSKICLNIHHNEINYFEKPRIIQDIMANEGFCITETISHPEGFVSGQHFIMSSYTDLVSTVLEWLKKPESARRLVANNALTYLATNYKIAQFVANALDLIHRN